MFSKWYTMILSHINVDIRYWYIIWWSIEKHTPISSNRFFFGVVNPIFHDPQVITILAAIPTIPSHGSCLLPADGWKNCVFVPVRELLDNQRVIRTSQIYNEFVVDHHSWFFQWDIKYQSFRPLKLYRNKDITNALWQFNSLLWKKMPVYGWFTSQQYLKMVMFQSKLLNYQSAIHSYPPTIQQSLGSQGLQHAVGKVHGIAHLPPGRACKLHFLEALWMYFLGI